MVQLMSSFNIAFRPDASAVVDTTAIAGVSDRQGRLINTMIQPTIPPSQMFAMAMADPSGMTMNGNYSTAMAQHPNPINIPSFAPTIWQTQLSQPAVQPMTMLEPLPLRHDSCSSMDSDPYIKSEESFVLPPSQMLFDTAVYSEPSSASPVDSSDEKPAVFSTDIDVLMRAIQSKTNGGESEREAAPPPPPPPPPPTTYKTRRSDVSSPPKTKKRYRCEMADCGKAFYQKTHLEIHTRAHTGIKPFICKEAGCGQRFSQLGNLKTHERRHTGERPYHCDICGKTFAQHGNVRAHKIVHTAAKPFTCRLDNCNKQFTQLGNLKSHQNKFHVKTIRRLKQRFENIREGDVVDSWEKEMWEYFGNLYKNCNKGIKGRGKDRRISTHSIDTGRRDSIMSTAS